MFMNLKSKIGDATDLKKLTSPQSLASVSSSRQRSSQHTPGSLSPRSQHSRQASTASLQAVGLPISPPQSPINPEGSTNNHDRVGTWLLLFQLCCLKCCRRWKRCQLLNLFIIRECILSFVLIFLFCACQCKHMNMGIEHSYPNIVGLIKSKQSTVIGSEGKRPLIMIWKTRIASIQSSICI